MSHYLSESFFLGPGYISLFVYVVQGHLRGDAALLAGLEPSKPVFGGV